MTRKHCSWGLLPLLIAMALPLGALAQAIRLGNEFQVNTVITDSQRGPSVAADADGDFIVAWSSQHEGSFEGIFARRFSRTGAPLATEFQVNLYTPGVQSLPSVAAEAGGNFIVAWESGYTNQDGSAYGVFARRFSAAGGPLSVELPVNTFTADSQRSPSIAAEANGDFVVAWQSLQQDGSAYGVFARRFSSLGVPLATEFKVNTFTENAQRDPSLAADADGDFVIAWESEGQDGWGFGVFARRFTSAGAALPTFQVNTYTPGAQRDPAVAADADGDFVVVWRNSDYVNGGLVAQRFSSAGAPLASEFEVINTYTGTFPRNPSVAAEADGDFVIAWTDDRDGMLTGVFARRFSSAGAPLGLDFQVNTFTPDYQELPTVAASTAGFVVAWHSFFGQDGEAHGIFAQRFARDRILDIDGNGSVDALTDALLVMRHSFGFTGATLITGAVDLAGCTRCTAPAIEAYLAPLL